MLGTEEYYILFNEIKNILWDYYEVINYGKFVADKETHDSIDIFVTYSKQQHDPDIIANVLKSRAYVRNGHITSYEYKGVKVNITYSAPDSYNATYISKCYGHLGKIIGIIASKLGVKYNDTGLWLKLYCDTKGIPTATEADNIGGHFEDILLSNIPQEIFTILGFNYDRWCCKFLTNVDIYEFIYNSKYFDTSMFDSINLQESMFDDFLNWIQQQPYKKISITKGQFRVNAIIAAHKVDEVTYAINLKYEKIRIKELFNYNMMIQLFGFQHGRELNQLMKWLHQRTDLEAIIKIGDSSMVIDKIRELLELYKRT